MVTIYHNPGCGTSRAVLEMIRAAGLQPRVVEYLQTPPTREELLWLVNRMGIPVRDLVRAKEPWFAQLGLGAPGVTDADLVAAMLSTRNQPSDDRLRLGAAPTFCYKRSFSGLVTRANAALGPASRRPRHFRCPWPASPPRKSPRIAKTAGCARPFVCPRRVSRRCAMRSTT